MTPHSARARKQSSGSNTSDEMQSRIDRLEGLVLSLMGSNGSPNSSPRNRERSDSTEDGLRNEKYHDDDEEDIGMRSIHEEDKGHESGRVEDEVEEMRGALGIMKMDQGRSYYRGETHWAAILSEVRFPKFLSYFPDLWEFSKFQNYPDMKLFYLKWASLRQAASWDFGL